MPGDLALLWLMAFPLMGSPGPATLSLAAVGTAFGARRGLPYLAGIIAGTTGVSILIATGITAIVTAIPAVALAITVLAALYILYLAYRIATAPALAADATQARAPTFLGGFFLAIANPKAFAAIGAVYSSAHLIEASPLVDAAAKVAALFLVILVVNSTWLWLGALFARHLRNPRIARIANIGFAVLLVLSVVIAFVTI